MTTALVLATTAACTVAGAGGASVTPPPPSVAATGDGSASSSAPTSAAVRSAPASAPAGSTPPGIAERPARFPARGDDLCEPLLRGRQPPRGEGPLPRSSTVVAARWCVVIKQPHASAIELVQSTGDVSILDDVLHDPPILPTPGTGCEAVLYPPVVLEVLDQHGRRHRPTLPTDQCSNPGHTRDALATTAYTVIARYPRRPVRLSRPSVRPSLSRPCMDQAGWRPWQRGRPVRDDGRCARCWWSS